MSVLLKKVAPKTQLIPVINESLIPVEVDSFKIDTTVLKPVSGSLSLPDIRAVTSLNLLRTHLHGAVKHAKIIFDDNSYREVVIAGLRNGVVWDEIIRALVDRELASIDPFAGLKNFLPERAS